MATQKALITDKSQFIRAGVGANSIVPNLVFYNGEDFPSIVSPPGSAYTPTKQYVGNNTPVFVDGIRGKALKVGKSTPMNFRDWSIPGDRKYMMSVWIQPTAADIAATTAVPAVIMTTRGDGYSTHRGFHIETSAGGLEVKVTGTDAKTFSANTNGGTAGIPVFKMVADQIYHIVLIYDLDSATGNALNVYVNKVQRIWAQPIATAPIFAQHTRCVTIGDQPLTNGVKQWPFDGWIDEAIYTRGSTVWTVAQMNQYYDDIIAKKFVDYSTTPGSIQLPIVDNIKREWYSDVIDLGIGFTDYGKAHIVGDIPVSSFITVSTAASSDGINFDAWIPIGQDETIASLNKKYLKVKVEMGTTGTGNPRLDEIQILDVAAPARINLTTEPLKLYKDLASGLESMGILKTDYDTIVEEQVNGEEILTFKLPLNDPKRRELGSEAVEIVVEIGRRRFTIKEMKDKRDDSGKAYTEFKAEALWYEIGDLKVPKIDLTETTPFEAMTYALANSVPATSWTINRVDGVLNGKRRTIRGDWKSVLEILRDIKGTFGGELVFDTYDKTISLIAAQGQDNGVRFYYGKNLKNVQRTVDTFSLVTRLYPKGKGELDIKTVHPTGLDYIEDTQWVDILGLRNRIRADVWKDDRYVIPQNLYDDALGLLTESAKPSVNYVINVQDLSRLSGHEHESFELGDTVVTIDREILNMELSSRVVRRKYNVREPQKTTVELEQPRKQLAEAKSRAFDASLGTLVETNPLNTDDVKQMTVFNHLLNSRADEGLVDWVATSADIDTPRIGFSGENSFRFKAEYGKSKKLSQTIYGVSHRTAYTVSAQVATDGTITRGGTLADPFVGVYVVITYDDGSVERKPLAIKDVTMK